MKKPRTLKQILIAALGKAWMIWPPRLEAKRRAKHPTKTGWFICELCKQEREKIEVDHCVPCISPSSGFSSWDEYIHSRFVESASSLQAICRDCHKKKTQEENKVRRLCKKLKNASQKI